MVYLDPTLTTCLKLRMPSLDNFLCKWNSPPILPYNTFQWSFCQHHIWKFPLFSVLIPVTILRASQNIIRGADWLPPQLLSTTWLEGPFSPTPGSSLWEGKTRACNLTQHLGTDPKSIAVIRKIHFDLNKLRLVIWRTRKTCSCFSISPKIGINQEIAIRKPCSCSRNALGFPSICPPLGIIWPYNPKFTTEFKDIP